MKTTLSEEKKREIITVSYQVIHKGLTRDEMILNLTEQAIIKNLEKEIDEFQNPYPKDVFVWNNKDKLYFNRGSFNEFIYGVVENTKKDIKKSLFQER